VKRKSGKVLKVEKWQGKREKRTESHLKHV
jgi:hypothetical protein